MCAAIRDGQERRRIPRIREVHAEIHTDTLNSNPFSYCYFSTLSGSQRPACAVQFGVFIWVIMASVVSSFTAGSQ